MMMKIVYGAVGIVFGVAAHWGWERLQRREDALMQGYLNMRRMARD